MIKEEYSPFKIVHHLEKIAELREGSQPTPLQVQIIPSNVCNQRCTFCAYRMKDYLSNEQFQERDILSYEKIIETLECFVDMKIGAVHYTGGGEPLVHPRIYDVFKETISRNLELALVSNGMALNEKICELLGDASWVRISMDAATAPLYGFIRNVSPHTFDKVLENIKALVKHRRKSIIGVGFVVEHENYKQIYDAAKLFKELGIDNFRISAAFTPMGYEYFTDIFTEARELSKKAESLSDQNYTVFNLFNERVKDVFEGTQDYDFCPIKDLLAYIGADYNVYTCCTLAYNQRGYIGSIKNQSFAELWKSPEKIKKFKDHNPRFHCKHPCMYKGKNEFINYCTMKNPKHINFI